MIKKRLAELAKEVSRGKQKRTVDPELFELAVLYFQGEIVLRQAATVLRMTPSGSCVAVLSSALRNGLILGMGRLEFADVEKFS